MTTSAPTITDQVASLKAGMAAKVPAEVLGRFEAEQSQLAAEGTPTGVAEAGTRMPDGALLDPHGEPTTLRQALDGRAGVVVFYRGTWCPFCNIALRAYQSELLPALTERGISLVAISPQKPDGSLSAAETNNLSYSVLSDPGNQIAGQLGILTRPSDGARESQRTLGLDLPSLNADGTDTLAMPTIVLVDADGVIRWIDVHPDYTTRTEPTDILNAVATLN